MAKADVSHEGEDLPVLQGRLREGRGRELSAPEHSDAQLWGLESYHKWWPLPQWQGRKPLKPRLGGRVCPGLDEGEYPMGPRDAEVGFCGRYPGHGVARADLGLGQSRREGSDS